MRLFREQSDPTLEDLRGFFVGDLEAAPEPEAPKSPPEPPSEAGAIAAILLACFSLFQAWNIAWLNGFRLVYGDVINRLDLRWAVGIHFLAAGLLMAASGRFAHWFAPPGPLRLARLTMSCAGVAFALISIQPLVVWFEGIEPKGKLGGLFSPFMDGIQAAVAPLVVALLLIGASFLLPKVAEGQEGGESIKY